VTDLLALVAVSANMGTSSEPLLPTETACPSTITAAKRAKRRPKSATASGRPFGRRLPVLRRPMARVFNAAGIVFKGCGFYVNDSRAAASKAAKSPAKPADVAAPASDAAAAPGTEKSTAPVASESSAPVSGDSGAKRATPPRKWRSASAPPPGGRPSVSSLSSRSSPRVLARAARRTTARQRRVAAYAALPIVAAIAQAQADAARLEAAIAQIEPLIARAEGAFSHAAARPDPAGRRRKHCVRRRRAARAFANWRSKPERRNARGSPSRRANRAWGRFLSILTIFFSGQQTTRRKQWHMACRSALRRSRSCSFWSRRIASDRHGVRSDARQYGQRAHIDQPGHQLFAGSAVRQGRASNQRDQPGPSSVVRSISASDTRTDTDDRVRRTKEAGVPPVSFCIWEGGTRTHLWDVARCRPPLFRA